MADGPRKCSSCSSEACSAKQPRPDESLEEFEERVALRERMCRIQHKLVVLSGKGGVGKSTVATNFALALALAGKRTGLLDVDLHGPSVPHLLKLDDAQIQVVDHFMFPAGYETLKVMSIGFLLRSNRDAVIWRGPMKIGVIKQLLKDVEWGDLDYLVIDCPPGTGDEPLTIAQLLSDRSAGGEDHTRAIVVTTPQELSLQDVRKSITFCQKVSLPVLGVIENMSGFACPHCGKLTEIFGSGGGERMAQEMNVPFLGRIPIDPQVVEAGDSGKPFAYWYSKTETAEFLDRIVRNILESDRSLSTVTLSR